MQGILKGYTMLNKPHYQYLTQIMLDTIILALAQSLDSWADECSKTIADGENMKIARILGKDDSYIQIKKIRASIQGSKTYDRTQGNERSIRYIRKKEESRI